MSSSPSFRRIRKLLAAAAVVAALGSFGARAEAALFQVTPVQLPLSAKVKSGILTIRNQGKEPMRVQATGFAWSQSTAGETQLAVSRDLVFFPSMLTLAPGESRNIRVGTVTPAGAVEKTYRVIVEELPQAQRPGDANAVRMLVRMSIPVFIEPAKPQPRPRLDASRVVARHLSFALANGGSAHFRARKVEVLGLDAAGRRLFAEALPAWYVLAGGSREYGLELPAAACGAARLEIRAEIGKQTISIPAARPTCAP